MDGVLILICSSFVYSLRKKAKVTLQEHSTEVVLEVGGRGFLYICLLYFVPLSKNSKQKQEHDNTTLWQGIHCLALWSDCTQHNKAPHPEGDFSLPTAQNKTTGEGQGGGGGVMGKLWRYVNNQLVYLHWQDYGEMKSLAADLTVGTACKRQREIN